MPLFPRLETERLILRPFARSDAKDVQRLAGDWAVADTTARIPHPYEDGMAEAWIAAQASEFEEGKGIHWAITRKEDGVLLGAIGLMDIAPGHKAEVGYWIGRPYWNVGFCTEAAKAALRHAFETMNLRRVSAYHLSRNPASGRVMQKIGMRHEGTRRQDWMKWDKLEDIELYGMLREDWLILSPVSQAE